MYDSKVDLVGAHHIRVKITDEPLPGTFQVNDDGGKAQIGRISVLIAKYTEDDISAKPLREFLYETFEERGVPRNNIAFYFAQCATDIGKNTRRNKANAIWGSPKTIADIREETLKIWGFGKLHFRESDVFADDELFIVYEGVENPAQIYNIDWPFLCRDGQIASHNQTKNAGYLLRIKEPQ